MFGKGISPGEVRRVMDEVEREVAAWAAGPAVAIVEVDDDLRRRAAVAATWPGATHRVFTTADEREALAIASAHPQAILWVCEQGPIDAARVIEATRRRCPVAAIALRTRALTGKLGTPVTAGGVFVPLRSAHLLDDFPALARASFESWDDRLTRHAHAEIGRRLAGHHSADEVRAAGFDPPARLPPRTLYETIADRLLSALHDHNLNVSSAAAELGVGRKAVYAWCRRYGIDLAALRKPSDPSRQRRNP